MKYPKSKAKKARKPIYTRKKKKTNAEKLLKYLRSCRNKGTTYGRIKKRFKWKDNYLSDLLKKLVLQSYNLRFEFVKMTNKMRE